LQNSNKMVTKIVTLYHIEYKCLFYRDLHMHKFLSHRILNPMQQKPSFFCQNQGYSQPVHILARVRASKMLASCCVLSVTEKIAFGSKFDYSNTSFGISLLRQLLSDCQDSLTAHLWLVIVGIYLGLALITTCCYTI
jgi:hypothetical protein